MTGPTSCAKCRVEKPSLFKVPDDVWAYYIEPQARGCVICRQCFDDIRQAVDTRRGPPPFGDFEIQTDRQLWAAAYARLIAEYPGIADELRAQAEAMDRGLTRREEES